MIRSWVFFKETCCVRQNDDMMKKVAFLRTSPYAKTIYKYCHIFLAVDLVLICLIAYGWYMACDYNFCTKLPRKSKTYMLAFGDSVTRGFVNRNLYYPYSKSLEKTLNRVHSRDTAFVVDNGGLNGDTAVGISKARLKFTLAQHRYEWVILLFGTNDLWRQFYEIQDSLYEKSSPASSVIPPFDVEVVFKSLKKLCKIALQGHRMVILGTITARQCEEDDFYMPTCDDFSKNRELLNKKIRSYVASSTEMILLADFDRHLEYKSFDKAKRIQYWQDNVHLTETGYELMAKLIYKKMQPYLPEPMRQLHVAKNVTLKV